MTVAVSSLQNPVEIKPPKNPTSILNQAPRYGASVTLIGLTLGMLLSWFPPLWGQEQFVLIRTTEINDNTLNGPTLNDTSYFGLSIANLGDLDGDGVIDITVGANFRDAGGNNRGAVYIHYLNADSSVKSTVEINSLTPNGPTLEDADYYGLSIGNLGDLDGDGVVDIAVGAQSDDAGGDNRGAVHIHYLNANGSVKSTVEINSNTPNGPTLSNADSYGSAIANLGDLDGDGVIDMAVGAYFDDTGGDNRGIVYIHYLNANGSVKSTVEINDNTPNGPTLNDFDYFGSAIANLGDLDGDGVVEIAVGTLGNDTGGNGQGAIHILFLNADGSVKSTVEINSLTLNGPTLSNANYYGISISNLGDIDGDGVADIAVGAHGDDTGGNDHGAVHVHFLNANGSVKSTVKINSLTLNGPTLNDYDRYGISIANLGDLDEDGEFDIAVGAAYDDTGGVDQGTVHIHTLAFVWPRMRQGKYFKNGVQQPMIDG